MGVVGPPRVDRIAPRVPYFTPVVAPGIEHCWTSNLSVGGMGLTGVVAGSGVLQPGDDLELQFSLEDAGTIQVIGRVAWTSRVRPDGRLGFGVQFRDLATAARTELARFLASHRPRVLVALASPDELAIAERVLQDVNVEIVQSADGLDPVVVQACAAIILFSQNEEELTGFIDALWKLRPGLGNAPSELPLAPITVCTEIDSGRLLPLVTEGKIYEVLRPPLDRRALMLAAQRSCERWALQMEVRWASLQLEGIAVTKQRAQSAVGPELPRHSKSVVRESDAMKRVYELIRTVAIHDVPVLLVGETGTGKELAAREIHALSKRASTPFVAQDCGALTESLLESELFGHVRGAFTGATHDHPGLFQIADGGTIFLDEIQNTSPALQAKLLRVVEQGEVRPVGGAKARRVDVRLVAACNVDLKQAVKEQRFRADFYYRLNRFPVELPALREHTEDILPLTHYFVASICEALERPVPRVDPRTERALLAHDWPGNIRELKNAIERSILLTPQGEPLRWDTLPADVRGCPPSASTDTLNLDAQVEAFERRVIQTALERNQGVVRRAARELGVNAITLARKIKRLGINAA